jgi:CubicO group peptidase (beta-lactamase class C family)
VAQHAILPLILLVALMAVLTGCGSPRAFTPYPWGEPTQLIAPGTFARLDSRLLEEHRAGRIAGGAVSVWRGGDIIYTNRFGYQVPGERSPVVKVDTRFDLASLTKPIAGIPIAHLRERGFRERDLLLSAMVEHATTIDDERLFPRLLNVRTIPEAEAILQPFGRDRVDRYNYSNAAYWLMGAWLLPSVSDMEARLRQIAWDRAGTTSFTWRPPADKTAASGRANGSGTWLRGRAFDPLAHYSVEKLDVPPLHSGLFGTADDVAHFAGWLIAGTDDAARQLRPLALESNRHRENTTDGRLVHVTRGGLLSATGPPHAPHATLPGRIIYHTGYTGCLLWVDRRTGTAVAILTNASATDALDAFERFAADIIRDVLAGTR